MSYVKEEKWEKEYFRQNIRQKMCKDANVDFDLKKEEKGRVWNSLLQHWCQISLLLIFPRLPWLLPSAEAHFASLGVFTTLCLFLSDIHLFFLSIWFTTSYVMAHDDYLLYCIDIKDQRPKWVFYRCRAELTWQRQSTAVCGAMPPEHQAPCVFSGSKTKALYCGT